MDKARYKIQRLATKTLDERRVEVILSTEATDRDGDIIRVSGWNLTNFISHPILLSSHNYYALTSQIGEWEDVKKTTKAGVKMLAGVANYYVDEGNEEADWGYKLASKGRAAYSVGFIPDMAKAKEIGDGGGWMPSWEFNGQELLECSHVTVPSNPEALQRIKGMTLPPDVAAIVDEVLGDAEPQIIAGELLGGIPQPLLDSDIERIVDAIMGKMTPKMERLNKLAEYLDTLTEQEHRRLAQLALREGVKEAIINGY